MTNGEANPARSREPVAWQHLKAYGYAPGNYMNKCHTCGKVVEFVDKRAITCRPCAEARHAAAPSPVAQAPAQAGGVARLAREAKTWIAQVAIAGHRHSPAQIKVAVEAMEAFIDRLAALATPPAQPVLAPVVREPLTDRQVQKFYAMLPDGQSAYANFVQGFRSAERAHGAQATTGEPS